MEQTIDLPASVWNALLSARVVFMVIGVLVVAAVFLFMALVVAEAALYAIIVTWMSSLAGFKDEATRWQKSRWLLQSLRRNFRDRLGVEGSSIQSIECNGVRYDPPFRVSRQCR